MVTNEQQARQLIVDEVKKVVGNLENHYKKFAEENKIALVPVAFIEASNKVFLDAYEKAALKEEVLK